MNPSSHKTCRKCGETKPATLEFFFKHSGGKFGLTPRCKPCVNEDNKSWADRNPDRARANANKRSKKHYHSKNKGSDPFKWALLIAIAYGCVSKDKYRKYHDITANWDELKQWIKDHADLGSDDSNYDYLCLLTGGYNEFILTPLSRSRNMGHGLI